jgi:large subunit ribosomal protein L19
MGRKIRQLYRFQQKYINPALPNLRLGDTISVGILLQEGKKQRIQFYQGVLIAFRRSSRNSTITLRRTFQGVGVERVIFIHSKRIQRLEVVRHAKVRRAKLYYLRNLTGKAARLREKFRKGSQTIIIIIFSFEI